MADQRTYITLADGDSFDVVQDAADTSYGTVRVAFDLTLFGSRDNLLRLAAALTEAAS